MTRGAAPWMPLGDADALKLVDALGVTLRQISKLDPRPRNKNGQHDQVDPQEGERLILRARLVHLRTTLEALASRRAKACEEREDDKSRCAVCGGPLVEDLTLGCVRGNCSHRPRPENLYARERAAKESAR